MRSITKYKKIILCVVAFGDGEKVGITLVWNGHNTNSRLFSHENFNRNITLLTQLWRAFRQQFQERHLFLRSGGLQFLITWRSTQSRTCGVVGSYQRWERVLLQNSYGVSKGDLLSLKLQPPRLRKINTHPFQNAFAWVRTCIRGCTCRTSRQEPNERQWIQWILRTLTSWWVPSRFSWVRLA